jgi:Lon protease-like protein
VIIPGEKVNLHIFEPRYKQLIAEAAANNITFGIPYVSEESMQSICSEIKLVKVVNEHSDGSSDITVEGIGLLNVIEFHQQFPGRLYPGGEVEKIAVDLSPDEVSNKEILPLLEKMYNTLNIKNVPLKDVSEFRTSDIIHKVGLSVGQEYEILQLDTETKRAEFLLQHLQDFIEVIMRTEEVKEKAALNGHFKHLLPPF